MSDQIEIIEEELQEAQNAFLAGARRILMAGIGAVSLAQEEIEDFVDKLVERGEIAEKDGRSLLNDILEKRKERAETSRKNVEAEVEKRVETLLHRMNVPSKRDIETLNEKISALTKKVDELKK